MLASFAVICFADLKKYKFTYLFAFPALHSDPSWRLVSGTKLQHGREEDEARDEGSTIRMTGQETATLVDCVQTWRYRVDSRQHGFFLAKKQRKASLTALAGKKLVVEDENTKVEEAANRPTTPRTPSEKVGFNWSVGSLTEYETGFFDECSPEDRYVCFADPSTYATYPGWMLRNLLVLIRRRWNLDRVQILCYRDVQARRDDAESIILSLELGESPPISSSIPDSLSILSDMPKVTGWERNNAGKVMSRIANLGEYMDPQRCVIIAFLHTLMNRKSIFLPFFQSG